MLDVEHHGLTSLWVSGVYFGQLLGMADPLSFVLGANGYRVGIAATKHIVLRQECMQLEEGSLRP